MRPLKPVLALLSLSLLACSGDFFKSCTSKVVGTTVETTKEVTTGVAEGFEEGRKSGTSIDGAVLVSTMEEVAAHGSISVAGVEAIDGSNSRVVFALENRGEQPLRFMNLEFSALDKGGFVQQATVPAPTEMTVPPRAKTRVTMDLPVAADQVGVVRAWTTDLTLPAPAAPAQ